ncbi:hypothetical protein D3C87_352380 [compost metagenome]
MKTNYFNIRQISLYTVLGFLGLAVSSCSSYQNTSSYDSDGIYGSVPRNANNEPVYKYNDGNVTQYNDGNNSGQNMNYKSYFSSMKDEFPVYDDSNNDAYSSNDVNDTIVRTQGYNSYPGWGEDTSNVNVNIYGGGYGGWNSWYGGGWGWSPGWNIGIGWGGGWGYGGWGWGLGWNSWYGGGWGWGGGWGYPYYPHYGHNHYYGNNYGRSTASYQGGRGSFNNNRRSTIATNNRRGSADYSSSRNSSRNSNASINSRSQGTRAVNNRSFNNSRNVNVARSRGDVQYNDANRVNSSRNTYNNSSRNNNNTYTPASRNNTYTPSRSNNAPSRSSGTTISPSRSSSGGSFGGGRSSGGGGGGGSRGGGGGRRG